MGYHRLNPMRLRAEIVKRGMDGRAFAVAAGISPATLSNVVNGRSVSARTMAAIARALVAAPVVNGIGDLLEEAPSKSNVPTRSHVL